MHAELHGNLASREHRIGEQRARHFDLLGAEPPRSPKVFATPSRGRESRSGPLAHEICFKLGESAEKVKGESASGGFGINRLVKGAQPHASGVQPEHDAE
jgi:hypothetical protein